MADFSVVFTDVSKRYMQHSAVSDISFELPKGKIIGLIGPNGSGKSTMLKLMAGLIRPSAGRVLVEGHHVSRHIRSFVSYASDKDALYGFYTIEEMVRFYQGTFPDFSISTANDMMEFLQLDKSTRVKSLSKGNFGRLKMLLTLARKAPVILMDEPLSGLDPMVRTAIIKSMINYVDLDRQTLILSTHEVAEVEPILDMVVLVYEGRLRAISTLDDIQEQSKQRLVTWMSEMILNSASVLS